MKKIISLALAVLFAAACFTTVSAARAEYNIILNTDGMYQFSEDVVCVANGGSLSDNPQRFIMSKVDDTTYIVSFYTDLQYVAFTSVVGNDVYKTSSIELKYNAIYTVTDELVTDNEGNVVYKLINGYKPRPTEEPEPSSSDKPDVKPADNNNDVWNEHHNRICGKKQKDGSIKFIPTKGNAGATGNDLYYLLSGNKKKKIILPKKKITIERTLMPGNNTTLIATGATVYQKDKSKNLLISFADKRTGKQIPVKKLKIVGGKWRINGYATRTRKTSTFRFLHSSNITLKKCDIQTNYICHAVELIACKNVKIDGCKLIAVGKTRGDSLEEALQIDIASTGTTTNILPKYLKGQVCSDITVNNCTIKGSRGVCANRTDTENNKWLTKHHKNITLIGNTVTGMTSEAVALHNTAGIKVKNNKIYSKGKRLGSTYSIGLNIASFGKTNSISKKPVVVTGNTIKGGRQALQIVTYRNTKSGAYGSHKFGKVTVKNNKLYCKRGKSNALLIKKCKKVKKSGNKTYKW